MSNLERKFDLFWRAANGPKLEPEFRFETKRRWRFDRAHLESRTAIEIEGGVWSGGRHTRGSGFVGDCDKYNEAALQGWTVFRLTSKQITMPVIERLVAWTNP